MECSSASQSGPKKSIYTRQLVPNYYCFIEAVAKAAVRSKAVFLLMLIHCFCCSLCLWEFCVWSLFSYVVLSVLFNICYHLDVEERVIFLKCQILMFFYSFGMYKT